MGLLQELNIGADTPLDADETEKQVMAGGLVPEGYHHAVLEGCREVAAHNGSKGRELCFKIVAGAGRGMEVKDTVWFSEKATKRAVIIGHRLGVLKKVTGPDGKNTFVEATPGRDFTDALGASVVIDVKHEPDEYTNEKGKKIQVTRCRLSFEGVLPLDDPRVKDVPKAKDLAAAAAGAGAKAGGPAAGAKKDDFSDL